MDLEQLKAKLKAGEITKEEFDAKVKELGLSEDNSKEKDEKEEKEENKSLSEEEIKKLIQSAEDRVRGEYSKKLKDIQAKYDELRNEKLSDEEKLQLKEQELEEKTRAFEKQKLDFEFTRHLASEKLPIELNNFVPGSDIEKKKENLTTLKKIIDSFVEERVKEKFSSQNLDVDKGSDNDKTITKEKFMQMSIDEKIKLAEENYELYKKLAY